MIAPDLKSLLTDTMTVSRLLKTGLFKKLPSPVEDIRQDLLLHRAVLDKALLDQFDKHEQYRIQSKLWATLENSDFVEVSERALLDPELVLLVFEQVTTIFRENGEDKYYEMDSRVLAQLSDEDREHYMQYEDPEINFKPRGQK